MRVVFEKTYLRELYFTGETTDKKHRFQPQVVSGYVKCVKALIDAERIEELFTYHSLRYEKLKGDKKSFSSVRINSQYRLEFREIVDSGDLLGLVICSLTDVTNHYK